MNATNRSWRISVATVAIIGTALLGVAGCERASPPAENGHELTLRQGELAVSVDPQYGGRLTGLWLGEHQFLSGPEVDANNFGSTFWLSPQAIWEWPPVVAHDSAAYQLLEQTPRSVRMASDSGAGATVEKSIRFAGDRLLQLDYRVTADQDFPELAAWQISRVANRGIAFAPVTKGSVEIVRGSMDVSVENDVLWLPLDPAAPLREGKVIANGSEGWLAYVDAAHLYLKLYPPVAVEQMATNEGDIELYLSDRHPYLELEVQSAARPLARGASLDWRTYWLVEPVPANMDVSLHSSTLLQYVRDLAVATQRKIAALDNED